MTKLFRFEGALFVEAATLPDAQRKISKAFESAADDVSRKASLPYLHEWTRIQAGPVTLSDCCSMIAPYHDPLCIQVPRRLRLPPVEVIETIETAPVPISPRQLPSLIQTIARNLPGGSGGVMVLSPRFDIMHAAGPLMEQLGFADNAPFKRGLFSDESSADVHPQLERICQALAGRTVISTMTLEDKTYQVRHAPQYDTNGRIYACVIVIYELQDPAIPFDAVHFTPAPRLEKLLQ